MGADSRSSIIYEELVDTREKLEWIRRFDEWTPADVRAPAASRPRGSARSPAANRRWRRG